MESKIYYKTGTGTDADALAAAVANAQPLSLSSIASLTDGSSYNFKVTTPGSKTIGVYTSAAAVGGMPTTPMTASGVTVSLQVGQVVVIAESGYCAAYQIVE